MIRAHLIISGFVQGVGFRYYIKEKADKLGLVGWVRNASDGRVEAVFEGTKKAVEEMIVCCKRGPFLASVRDVEISVREAIGDLTEFTII